MDGGADVNQVGAGNLNSPLLTALMNGHFDLVMELLRRSADPRLADYMRRTPLYAVLNTQWAPKARYPHSSRPISSSAPRISR